jgi:hypothetical protein
MVISAGPSFARSVAPVIDSLVEDRVGAVIDWRRGTIAATGGAAADQRMPSAEAARPGAERRARAAALARLAELLRILPLGGARNLDELAVRRALTRARATSLEYQSNGGAVVRLEIDFGAWSDTVPIGKGRNDGDVAGPLADDPMLPRPAEVALTVPEAHLAAAPLLVVGGREMMPARVRYMTATELPVGVKPLVARADKQGRLLVAAENSKAASATAASPTDGLAAKFAGKSLVVYVQKILR